MFIAFFASCVSPQLAAQPPLAPPPEAKTCEGCHGPGGNSVTPYIPSLAGQPRVYLENTLVLTREGLRGNPVMQGLMKGKKDAEIVAVAKYFASLPIRPPVTTPPDKALQKRGRELIAKLHCASCHDKTFRGREQMPRLAAQREEFLDARMIALRDKPPPGTDTIMNATVRGISDDDIKALAHFMAHLR